MDKYTLQRMYIGALNLPLIKEPQHDVFNFRCVFCGDSQKKKSKRRGYLLHDIRRGEGFVFYCHNCGRKMSFASFLKQYDPWKYRQYRLDLMRRDSVEPPAPLPVEKKKPVENRLHSIPKVWLNSTALAYCKDRQLPDDRINELYFADNFYKWSKINENSKSDERIVIPFLTPDRQTLIAVQGRAINNQSQRYITVKIRRDLPKVYGLEHVNVDKTVFVLEGPFDSMFLDNAIAMGGADLNQLKEVDMLVGRELDYVFVYDNEPRNVNIRMRMDRALKDGHKVCVWPRSVRQKDINNMILAGLSVDFIQKIIDNNVYSGTRGLVKLGLWR